MSILLRATKLNNNRLMPVFNALLLMWQHFKVLLNVHPLELQISYFRINYKLKTIINLNQIITFFAVVF